MSDNFSILMAKLASIEKAVQRVEAFLGKQFPVASDDADLDSQWGDEQVKVVPKNWAGEPVQKGQPMSQCPPEFLLMLAETMEYFATKNDASGAVDNKGNPKSVYDRRSAARARGWAARLRKSPRPAQKTNGAAQPPKARVTFDDDSEEHFNRFDHE